MLAVKPLNTTMMSKLNDVNQRLSDIAHGLVLGGKLSAKGETQNWAGGQNFLFLRFIADDLVAR